VKKRIGILSMQRVVNFGSVLQAWSLREMIRAAAGVQAVFLDIQDKPALESLEDNVSARDYEAPAVYSRSILQRGKRWIITRLSGYNKGLIRRFMREELRLDDVREEQDFDHVVIGSDEVFNHAKGIRLQLHGEVEGARRVITYAASCGSAKPEHVREEDSQRVRQAMRRFEAISVRDAGTKAYAEAFYDGPMDHHMDPVLMGPLHARRPGKVWLKKYLLVYAYGQRIRTAEEIGAIRAFAREKSLTIVAMGGSQFWCDLYIPAAPMRMLDWFAHADYVVTDTFHGAIFSVVDRRRFAVIIRESNRNKLTSLLADLTLSARQVPDVAQLSAVLDTEIDYAQVESLLKKERIRAMDYLKEQLSDE